MTDEQYDALLAAEDNGQFADNYWVRLVAAEYPPYLMRRAAEYRDVNVLPDIIPSRNRLVDMFAEDKHHFEKLVQEQGDTTAGVMAKLGLRDCIVVEVRLHSMVHAHTVAYENSVLKLQAKIARDQGRPRQGRHIDNTHAEVKRQDYTVMKAKAHIDGLRINDFFSKLMPFVGVSPATSEKLRMYCEAIGQDPSEFVESLINQQIP